MKRPKKIIQVSNAKAAQEGLSMTIVCNGYLDVQVSKENLINIQRAIGGLGGRAFSEGGLIPKLIGTYWAKGAAIVVCQDKETRDWLWSNVPVMKAWEGCRLEVFAPCKRVAAWFSGPSEGMECLFQHLVWLKEGLNTGQWRLYECKEELSGGVCLCLVPICGLLHPWRG